MKKSVSILLSCVMLMLLLCACESEQVKQAKTAYADGKYSEVVELLSKEENLNEGAQDMLTISEANVMFENKEYLEAVKKIASSKDGIKNEQFEEMFSTALTDAIANKSAENVLELLSLDESKSDSIYEVVTTACSEKDYNGFLVLDGLVDKLEDSDLRTKLVAFNEDSEILRAEAFLVGTWEWKENEGEEPSNVIIVPYNNNLVGQLSKIGTYHKGWGFREDDVYWEDFEFQSGEKLIFTNNGKYDDGTNAPEKVSGTIDYKEKTFTHHYNDGTADRAWKRID